MSDEAVAGRRHAAVARIRRRLDDVTQDETNHLLRLNQARRGGRQRATATRPHRVDEHEPGLLFERHARDQIVDARLDRESPVFVTVDRPTAVCVPELPAIDGQHRARSHLNEQAAAAAAPPRSMGPRAVADKHAITKRSDQGRKRRPGEDNPNLQVTYITSWPERRVFY